MFIYKTTNLINKKIYIGRYSGQRSSYLGSGKLIKKAIKKYGKENFCREILEEGIENNDILNEREIYWIAFYDSTNSDIGYNIVQGGQGTLGFSVSEETKKKLSDLNRGENNPRFGKPLTQEVKDKISQSQQGDKNHNFGNPTSEETKDKISKANKGKKRSEETKQKISEGQTGDKNHNYGKSTPESIRKKISDANKGKIFTDEHKALLSIASSGPSNHMFGKHHSDETKEIMSRKHMGKKSSRNSTSKYVGIYWYKRISKWSSRIIKDNHTYFLGYFDSEEEAALAYNKKAIELYGESANINAIE